MDDVAIVDASPLIHLGKIGRLELLRVAATRVSVPDAVLREVGAHGLDDVVSRAVRAAPWIETVPAIPAPRDIGAWDLGEGETQVLALVRLTPRSVGVADDGAARRCARHFGLPMRGTLGVILVARRKGHIAAARPVVAELLGAGMRLSQEIADRALRDVGE